MIFSNDKFSFSFKGYIAQGGTGIGLACFQTILANEGCFFGGSPNTHVKILVVTVPCPFSTIESEVVKILAMFAVLKGGLAMWYWRVERQEKSFWSNELHRSNKHEAIEVYERVARIHNFEYDMIIYFQMGMQRRLIGNELCDLFCLHFKCWKFARLQLQQRVSCCCFMTWLLQPAINEVVLRHQHVSKVSCSQLAKWFGHQYHPWEMMKRWVRPFLDDLDVLLGVFCPPSWWFLCWRLEKYTVWMQQPVCVVKGDDDFFASLGF